MDHLTDDFLVEPGRFDGTVLVTGAGGCIGAWTMAILARSGEDCVALDLEDNRHRPALVMGDAMARSLVWETGDIAHYERLTEVITRHRVKAIIHYAGLQVPFCKADPALGARVNVEGTVNVLQAAREFGIKRTVLASSVAALAMPPGGPWYETLYGAYKQTCEHAAHVYWADWQVPSISIRPCVVYGLARDQGMTSRNTIAIQAAAWGEEFVIPYSGPLSWLYAGEAAAAFIAAVSRDGDGAYCFNLNGPCETVENGLEILHSIAPEAKVSCQGTQLPFQMDMDDGPLRAHVPEYPSIPVSTGIRVTYEAFMTLKSMGKLPQLPD